MLLAMLSVPVAADVVVGRVIDALTKQPLEEAVVAVESKVDRMSFVINTMTDSLGNFSTDAMGMATLRATMVGYKTTIRRFVAGDLGGNDTIHIGDIAIEPSDVLLKSAVVQGHAKRFTMRGDTVVFNPAAFNLSEGARLEELIKKLPGVTIKDGQLYWMDKPIRILMNGQPMMANNDLLTQQLPAEAVENIKAYNKASKMKERTGKDDGAEDHVLDITIKPGFLDKWYGTASLTGQTPKRAQVNLDATYLSIHDPVLAVFNWDNLANHVLEKSFSNSMTGSYSPFGRQLFGALGYKHQKGKDSQASYISPFLNIGRTDTWQNTHKTEETFFPNQDRTFQLTDHYVRKNVFDPKFMLEGEWNPDSANSLSYSFEAGYSKENHVDNTLYGVYSADPYSLVDNPLHSSLPALLAIRTVNSDTRQTTREDASSVQGKFKWTHFFADKSQLEIGMNAGGKSGVVRELLNRDISYVSRAPISEVQYGRTPSHSSNLEAFVSYERWFGRNCRLSAKYEYDHERGFVRNDLYRLSDLPSYDGLSPFPQDSLNRVRDVNNSYRRRDIGNSQKISLDATWNVANFQFFPSLEVQNLHRQLNYLRGRVDTTSTRRDWYVKPEFFVQWKIRKGVTLKGGYEYSATPADQLSQIAWVDTSNPLYITEGNPNLKDSYTHHVSLSFLGNIARSVQSFQFTADYRRFVNPIGTLFSYDSTTGVYRSRPINVRGGYEWVFGGSYQRALSDYFTMGGRSSVSLIRSYGYLTATPLAPISALNRSQQTQFSFRPNLVYESQKLLLELASSYSFSYRNNSETFNYNNRLGAYFANFTARYKIPNWTFQTNFRVQGYHGYVVPTMNRPRFIWDSNIDWGFLHGKAHLTLSVDDILNQRRLFFTDISAYSRTETIFETMNHFVSLTFKYHFDAHKTKEGREREKYNYLSE